MVIPDPPEVPPHNDIHEVLNILQSKCGPESVLVAHHNVFNLPEETTDIQHQCKTSETSVTASSCCYACL